MHGQVIADGLVWMAEKLAIVKMRLLLLCHSMDITTGRCRYEREDDPQ